VYSDINANGSQDNGEPGLAGWYVFIDLGETGQYANGDPYVLTDANGNYLFQGLTPGTYTTLIYPESGYTTIEGATGWDNTVTASQSSVGGNFGEAQPTGTVAGTVYVDANADGAFDAGDAGLVNWQVYLDLGNSGAFVAGDPVATTDENGSYSFTGLAAGSYTVRVIPQSGYTTDEGSLGWIANAIAGQTSNGGSFGESQATGSLSGTVYDDNNRDGVQDGFESGVSNWAVYIDTNNDGTYDTGDIYVITDSNGGYSFTGLAPGQYVVRAYVYTSLRWVAREGASGWAPIVVANQTSFGGNFGES
jgi:protocatechuate 3,4-dioxygenase beta subunit